MSLMRLLASGRSLVGVNDNTSPYRMRPQNLLPKFGSSKNPFAQPPKPAAPAAPPAPVKMVTASLFEAGPAKPVAVATVPESRRAALHPVRVEPKPAPVNPSPAALTPVAPAPVRRPARFFGWVKGMNPFSWLPASRPKRSARALPVQTELSLEKVRVIRNDLNDADLEIVPGRLMGLPSAASPILPSVTRTEPTVWGRLASLYMDAGGTQS